MDNGKNLTLSIIKEMVKDGAIAQEVAEKYFPELAESEDERIRKEITELVMKPTWKTESEFHRRKELVTWLEKQGEGTDYANKEYWRGYNEGKQEILDKYAELEKQGEQKPADVRTTGYWLVEDTEQKPVDELEPKFKIGDWVVDKNGIVKQILSYKNGVYKHTKGYSAKIFEDEWRMWDVTKDAKDGDVLATNDWIFIFKGVNNNNISCYCHYDYDEDMQIFNVDTNYYMTTGSPIYPATKEERALLFQKMKEVGYEWDAEHKQLNKIEQKPAWSEEDEVRINRIVACLENLKVADDDILLKDVDWLKSLRDRVQPKQEWSEEDERMYIL